MATRSVPLFQADIGSVNGVTIGLTERSRNVASSDVGRLIILTSGMGYQQVRKIVGADTNNHRITIDHPFDAAAFPWITEVNPVVGDGCVFSYRSSEIVSFLSAALSTAEQNIINISSNRLGLNSGAYVHFENKTLTFNSSHMEIGNNGGIILGWYDYVEGEAARPKDICNIIDTSTSIGTGNQMRQSNNSYGMLHMYGGSIWIRNLCFWRLYRDGATAANAALVDNRFIDVFVEGNLGCRIDGDRTIITATATGNNSNLGPFNPRSAVAHPAIGAINCNQAVYVWLNEGASGRVVITDAIGLSRIISIDTGGLGAGEVLEVEIDKARIDEVGVFGQITRGTYAPNHTLRFGNKIIHKYVNEDTTAFVGQVKTHLVDTNDIVINEGTQTINDGNFNEIWVRHTDVVTRPTGAGTTRRLSDGIQYAPYTITSVAWGKLPHIQTITAETTFDASLTLLNDATLTETDKAVVDAYTDADTAEKIYDLAMSWQADNPDYLHGVTRFGKTLDFGDHVLAFLTRWQPNTEYPVLAEVCYNNNVYILNYREQGLRAPLPPTDTFNGIYWQLIQSSDSPYNHHRLSNGVILLCFDGTLDANIITTGTITIDDEARILGTIRDASGVRVRLTLPANSVIKGDYTPPDGAETAIPFETLASGTKSITMPPNSAVKLYSKAAGKLPRLDRFNVGEAGINLAPEQINMNGIVSTQPWESDITSTAFTLNNNGLIELTFGSLDNFPTNTDGRKHLTANDAANFVNRVHFLENYATISLNSLAADHIESGANNQVLCEASIRFVLADTLDADLLLEMTFDRRDPSYTLERPRTATNKRQVWIALNLVDNANPLSGQDIAHIIESSVGDDIDDITDTIAQIRETVTSNSTSLTSIATQTTNISVEIEELAENQEIEHLVLVKNLKPLPVFNESSSVHTHSVANGIASFTRTGGEAEVNLITYANLPESERFRIGGETGATDFVMFIRNPGTAIETLTIYVEFHIAGSAIPDTNRTKTIILEPSGAYQSVIFNVHGVHHSDLVETIQLGIAGMGLGAAGGLEILELSAHRVGTPEDEGAISRESIMTQLRMIQSDTGRILREVG